jgi:hypothetical protein
MSTLFLLTPSCLVAAAERENSLGKDLNSFGLREREIWRLSGHDWNYDAAACRRPSSPAGKSVVLHLFHLCICCCFFLTAATCAGGLGVFWFASNGFKSTILTAHLRAWDVERMFKDRELFRFSRSIYTQLSFSVI